jgi:hypothetical protein
MSEQATPLHECLSAHCIYHVSVCYGNALSGHSLSLSSTASAWVGWLLMAHHVEHLLTWCSLFHVHVWPCARPLACSVGPVHFMRLSLCIMTVWCLSVCTHFHSISHSSNTKNALYIRYKWAHETNQLLGQSQLFQSNQSSLLIHGNIH